MRWPQADPNWSDNTKRAYRNMIMATRRACVANNVTPHEMMQAVAQRVGPQKESQK